MTNIIVAMNVCRWFAHELHYGAHGEGFYAMHLLADRLDFGSAEDDLKELWFLGEKKSYVPSDAVIAEQSIATYKASRATEDMDNRSMVARLSEACTFLVCLIEEFKRNNSPTSGVSAVLDEVSKVATIMIGLCERTMSAYAKDNVNG